MAAKKESIIVTIADEGLATIDELAQKLKSKGMTVDRVLRSTGVISGSAEHNKLPSLRTIEGVHSVEPELSAELPPSGSPLQ